jgi:hypothetical protein
MNEAGFFFHKYILRSGTNHTGWDTVRPFEGRYWGLCFGRRLRRKCAQRSALQQKRHSCAYNNTASDRGRPGDNHVLAQCYQTVTVFLGDAAPYGMVILHRKRKRQDRPRVEIEARGGWISAWQALHSPDLAASRSRSSAERVSSMARRIRSSFIDSRMLLSN